MTSPSPRRIFHLVEAERSQPAAGNVGTEALAEHGFVHCCFREQLAEVAAWWFDPAADLVALEVDPDRLSSPVRVEAPTLRWYPHVLGPLDAGSVVARHRLSRNVDGTAGLPAALGQPPPSYQVVARHRGVSVAVRWEDGAVDGDPAWAADARAAVEEGRLVELIGPGGPHGPATVVAPASLASPYGSFALLAGLVDGVERYDGDSFAGGGP